MSTRELPTSDAPSDEVPVTPSVEDWRRLGPREREAHIDRVHAALEDLRELMSGGLPHSTAKMGAISVLGDFFQRIGRRVFLAAELPVLYPGEPAFDPDVLAVRDVEDLGYEDTRQAWVVADEGRGPDWILEILVRGNRNKALVRNVARYARLGVSEYFVYDRLNQRLYGYRLPVSGARR